MTAIQALIAFPALLAIGAVFGLFAMCVFGAMLLTWSETRAWLWRRADRRHTNALSENIGARMAENGCKKFEAGSR